MIAVALYEPVRNGVVILYLAVRRTIALCVALALVLVIGACNGDGVSPTPTPAPETVTAEPSPAVTATPTLSPTAPATQSASPTPSPVASPSVSPTPTPVATPSVSPTATPAYQLPTPYAPMAVGALGAPSCAEGWAPYDIAAASYAFCAPQGWDVIVGSSDARMVDVWNPAFSARMAESGPWGDILPGELSVRLDSEPKVTTIEKWAESCDEFELTVSGEQASGCVRYGDPIMGLPEDMVRVAVWIDRGETILIVSGGFWVSETADADKETILEIAKSLQLR